MSRGDTEPKPHLLATLNLVSCPLQPPWLRGPGLGFSSQLPGWLPVVGFDFFFCECDLAGQLWDLNDTVQHDMDTEMWLTYSQKAP